MAGIGPFVPGIPGIRAAQSAIARVVFRQVDLMGGLAQGRLINGEKATDSGNTGDITDLRAGLLMGMISATGLWANSIIGVTSAAYTSGGTQLTVSAAQATELVRRIGTSGTFKTVGPPTAAGTVAVTSTTYSAVNTTTGVITVTSLGVDKISGSWVMPTDGSETIRSFMPDGFPTPVVNSDGTRITVQYPMVPVAGIIESSALINWPSDTSMQTYLKDALNAVGKYVFSSDFTV